MTDPIEPFLGTWILDVEASAYEQSAPLKAASMRIETEGPRLVFHMLTLDGEGETVETEFKGIPNGRPTKLDESGLVDAMVLFVTPEGALVSEARRGGAALMSAVRTLSQDQRTMTITQTVHLPDETSPVDTTVYRRAQ